jgi:hypothetical protein
MTYPLPPQQPRALLALTAWRSRGGRGVLVTAVQFGGMLASVVSPEFLRLADRGSAAFSEASPFPHLVFDGFLRTPAAEALLDDYSRSSHGWTYLNHVNEKKRQLTDRQRMQNATLAIIDALQTDEFVSVLEKITGVAPLIPDPELEGSGLHETPRGGFLNMHVDFITHAVRRRWSRQLNLLVYLNHDWPDEYRGHLELWNRDMKSCEKKILPLFNRCVIFQTSNISYHGYPAPLLCPEGTNRRSLALYYYKDEGHELGLASTRYAPRPDDGLGRRALIRVDTLMLRVFAVMKRYFGVTDRVVSWILRRF